MSTSPRSLTATMTGVSFFGSCSHDGAARSSPKRESPLARLLLRPCRQSVLAGVMDRSGVAWCNGPHDCCGTHLWVAQLALAAGLRLRLEPALPQEPHRLVRHLKRLNGKHAMRCRSEAEHHDPVLDALLHTLHRQVHSLVEAPDAACNMCRCQTL